jgi:4-hydroxybenzoate polyprenyltransferase
MTRGTRLVAAARLVHPAPTVAVVALSAALAVILAAEGGLTDAWRIGLVVASVLGSQIFTGALNEWADHERDTIAQPHKPIPSGALHPTAALALAAGGLALQVATSAPLGVLALGLGLAASASAMAYNLWLSRTPSSVLPYLVSFGILPLWIAAGVGVELSRVAMAPLLVGPFAAAAHLANALRDFEADATLGSRSLAQLLGRRRGLILAWALAMSVGIGVGATFALTGALTPGPAVLGLVGLAAVAQGIGGPHRLWIGILVAAVAWTAAWALATG